MMHATAIHSSSNPKLLVIDDEVALCEFARDVGEAAGFLVTTASAPALVEAALALDEDMILLDLMMPGIDGIEVLRKLGAQGCTARIVLTSGMDRKVLETARRLGVAHGLNIVGHLQKPVRAAELDCLLQKQRAEILKVVVAESKKQSVNVSAEELRAAIEGDQLVVHYQPQVALKDGSWAGVEALVRWQHPLHGLLYPGHFVELAEQSGLGLELTYAVVTKVLADWKGGGAAPQFDGLMSINLPAVALTDVGFPGRVSAMTAASGCANKRLRFELTETSTARDSAQSLDILARLRMHGFTLSIDDFGTGHSSLERLRNLPFGELKVDMVFVRELETDRDSRVIVESSIALGRELGMEVVAEGVENEASWHLLQAMACDIAQGYFIGRPMSLEQIAVWRQRWVPPVNRG